MIARHCIPLLCQPSCGPTCPQECPLSSILTSIWPKMSHKCTLCSLQQHKYLLNFWHRCFFLKLSNSLNCSQNKRFSLSRKGQNNLMGFSKSGGGPWNCHCNKMFSLLLSNALSILPHKHFYIFRHKGSSLKKWLKSGQYLLLATTLSPPKMGQKRTFVVWIPKKCVNATCNIFRSDLFFVMKIFVVYFLK